ncbi:aminopeptidase N [Dietzia sp. HMSC21D01]|uniref:Aminopeptidase N n=1 Tax=Dietzia cinnamea TaxID=321318 RepID=A0AAW5Q7J9_9ACTN|nr:MULTISPECIES: aminopeptidase N [Dietzia]PWD97262.1 aminopeptidase N [Dietzia maris]MBM7230552.1 aminopeptidase N [Dietzia cinnamea]MCT1639760.1 aminopeptidase N [Dietzia cinnamea]MCT1863410.1 aminopeptidase N [Dietzia cinnamea]MCT2029420.1 aminopeptidase N [Dietzia cinnamea]
MRLLNLTRADAAARSDLLSVESYDVEIDLTDGSGGPGTGTFRSRTVVRFSCARPGAETFIDLRSAVIRSAVLNGRELFPAGEENRYDDEEGLTLPDLQESNELVVDADLAYTTTGEGLHRMVDPADGEVYLYSQFETADAKRVFACFDQPDLKARYTLTVTAPEKWVVVANTLAEESPAEGGGVVHRFAPTEIMSTYLVALIAGPYHVVEDAYTDEHGTIPLRLLCRASLAEYLDADRLFAETKEGFGFYHREFGLPYAFGKYDQIFVPEFNAGAMENAGAVTFLEDYVFRSRVTGYRYERRNETILHEMAHMWFGDLVTMRWWDDLWLNESFATFASVLAQVDATQYTEAWTTFANVEKSWAYRQDQLPSTHPVAADMTDLETVEANFDGITYAKGASVLKQLVAYVGREPFLAGLRAYFAEHAFGNAEFDDLLSALEESSGRDLSGWADQWLRTTGINPISVEVSTSGSGAGARISELSVLQGPAAPGAGELRTHRLGVGLYNRDDSGALVRTARAELDVTGERTVVADLAGQPVPDLVLPNDEDLTYCSVRLDERSLATVLDSLENIVDPLARTLCWSALWEMTREARLPARRFVEVVSRAVPRESQIGVVQRVLTQAQTALARYADPDWAAATGWATFSGAMLAAARDAEPGSDHQLAFLTALCACPIGIDQQRVLGTLLDAGAEDAGLPGLVVDTDLRWTVLTALVAAGVEGVDRIDAELAADDTAGGARRAATARAARPSVAAKEEAEELILTTGADAPTNAIVRATLLGLDLPGHEHLLTGLCERYLDDVTALWKARPGDLAQTVAEGIFPSWAVDGETVERFEQVIADESRPSSLRRIIAEQTADMTRALKARAVDAAEAD